MAAPRQYVDPFAAQKMALAQQTEANRQRYEQQQLAQRAAEMGMKGEEFGQRERDMVNNARNAAIQHLLTYREQRELGEGRLSEANSRDLDRSTMALLSLSTNPIALQDFGKQAPEIRKQIVENILKRNNIDIGNMPPDERQNALQQYAVKTGQAQAPRQAPTTQAPAPGGAQAPTRPVDPLEQFLANQITSGGGALTPDQTANPAQTAAAQAAGRAQLRQEQLQGAGAVHYDPELQANVRTAADGSRFVVGAPDPSVGAARGPAFVWTAKGPHTIAAFNREHGGYSELSVSDPAKFAEKMGWTPFHPAELAPKPVAAAPPSAPAPASAAAPAQPAAAAVAPKPETQQYGQPTQFHTEQFAPVARALGIPQVIHAFATGGQPETTPTAAPPPQFAPNNLVPRPNIPLVPPPPLPPIQG